MALPSTQLLKPKSQHHPWLLFHIPPSQLYQKILWTLPPKYVLSSHPLYFSFLPLPSQLLPHFSCFTPYHIPLLTTFQPPGPPLCSSNSHAYFYLLDLPFSLSRRLFSQILAQFPSYLYDLSSKVTYHLKYLPPGHFLFQDAFWFLSIIHQLLEAILFICLLT